MQLSLFLDVYLQAPGRSVEFLLLTFARASQDNAPAPLLYSAR